jgi:uncharacterized Zn-binding protein involved in type VI secretion
MPGPLFHVAAVAICPHGGQVTTIPTNVRVTVMGQPVATMNDQFLVAGCAFTVGPKPQPCVKVQWLVPSARVKVMGVPAILAPGPGLCQSVEQIPQGPPSIITVQPRVTGM